LLLLNFVLRSDNQGSGKTGLREMFPKGGAQLMVIFRRLTVSRARNLKSPVALGFEQEQTERTEFSFPSPFPLFAPVEFRAAVQITRAQARPGFERCSPKAARS
jgi:hypothetical protein